MNTGPSAARLPRSTERGRIEAFPLGLVSGPGLAELPRSTERGRIEARPPPETGPDRNPVTTFNGTWTN